MTVFGVESESSGAIESVRVGGAHGALADRETAERRRQSSLRLDHLGPNLWDTLCETGMTLVAPTRPQWNILTRDTRSIQSHLDRHVTRGVRRRISRNSRVCDNLGVSKTSARDYLWLPSDSRSYNIAGHVGQAQGGRTKAGGLSESRIGFWSFRVCTKRDIPLIPFCARQL